MYYSKYMNTICLTMLVNNDINDIEKCLDSVKEFIHYWLYVILVQLMVHKIVFKCFLKNIVYQANYIMKNGLILVIIEFQIKLKLRLIICLLLMRMKYFMVNLCSLIKLIKRCI